MALENVSAALLYLIGYDLVFLIILLAIIAVLAYTKQAAYAVMKRNFVGYFSNPTGYVFLCIFVFLTSVAAFWPYEFFNSNLATLDSLNSWFPMIMLVFIPAITMSIWAEEKRQGTDELLLTLPADDFDIVIGKYASATLIFTASLLFSQISTFTTLAILTEGSLDVGLIFTTYLGYWFVGLAMIAIGMIASFLTGNLTVGFILGALFNAPLAFASLADSVSPSKQLASWVEGAGISRPFDDFGRGVISFSSLVYFLLVAAVALYVCMVLIGRRHWTGGKDGNSMMWHYVGRSLALVALTVGLVLFFREKDPVRQDLTEGQVSSLADSTKTLIRDLEADRPIQIDAFISKEIPEIYAKTRYELINLLKEFRSEAAAAGKEIEVNLYDGIELFSDEAALADERFGIEPVERMFRERGAYTQKELILGAAIRSGLEKVTIPLFQYGIPVEYELVRSINTVARGTRKRVGIVATDARLMGGSVMSGMSMRQIERHPLIEELSRQYEVEEVTLEGPVTPGLYDALIAVQPSSLGPEQFDRFNAAVAAGVPAVIFEDPRPIGASYITATGDPKQSAGGMFGGGQPQPKGDINQLWKTLGVRVPGQRSMQNPNLFNANLVWQDYNPYPNLEAANPLWLFIDEAVASQPGGSLSDDSPITGGLQQVLAIVAGAIEPDGKTDFTYTPLLTTGPISGTVDPQKAQAVLQGQSSFAAAVDGLSPSTSIAMQIEGAVAEGNPEARPVRAIYISDTDLILPEFLLIRADPDQIADMQFQFKNVTFVLNAIDYMTGEDAFIDVRNHEPVYASLRMIDSEKEAAQRLVREQSKAFQTQFDETIRDAQEKIQKDAEALQKEVEELQAKNATGEVPDSVLTPKLTQFRINQENQQRALAIKRQKLERERDQKIQDARRAAELNVTQIQNYVKAAAVALPCIPPLLIGVMVFASRRLRERENITKARLK